MGFWIPVAGWAFRNTLPSKVICKLGLQRMFRGFFKEPQERVTFTRHKKSLKALPNQLQESLGTKAPESQVYEQMPLDHSAAHILGLLQ